MYYNTSLDTVAVVSIPLYCTVVPTELISLKSDWMIDWAKKGRKRNILRGNFPQKGLATLYFDWLHCLNLTKVGKNVKS